MMMMMMDLRMVGLMVGILSESAEVLRAMIVELEAFGLIDLIFELEAFGLISLMVEIEAYCIEFVFDGIIDGIVLIFCSLVLLLGSMYWPKALSLVTSRIRIQITCLASSASLW